MELHFTDGTSITTQQAASLFEQEGKLGTGNPLRDDGTRCALGVIEDWFFSHGIQKRKDRRRQLSLNSHGAIRAVLGAKQRLVMVNDFFVGTDEERAVYMAGLFRAIT